MSQPILVPTSSQCTFDALVIMGPTASGKTQLALDLAKEIPLEVISVDSVQVYRGMDIGTAKVTAEERKRVPHHLIDVRSVSDPYHLAAFLSEVESVLQGILKRGSLPVFVGGSGFYFEGLFRGLPPTPPLHQEARAKLERELEEEGVHSLYARLCSLDPQAASLLSKGDRHKIVRALEVIEVTGQLLSSLRRQRQKKGLELRARLVRLESDRENLRQKVLRRCDLMLERGLLEEVEGLIPQGIKENPAARTAIGYRHFLEYLDGHVSFDESVYFFKQVSCQLIKKQETWSRSRDRFVPVEVLASRKALDRFMEQMCSWSTCV
ncbi:tRNA (adenosine(37)-N6)-dimethylallyltransferase MiaA [Candidatus Similichlamydia laticola]|nr:tRNA (adenosine(37)-N6)-dimethylallyltransferase MiaA [Candidatus Similichlamydia laticola]